MKEAANSLLKVLEEPPDFATIFLLTYNAGELLPTIQFERAITFRLVRYRREKLKRTSSAEGASLSRANSGRWWQSCPAERSGRAEDGFDLAAYMRRVRMLLLHSAAVCRLVRKTTSSLFRISRESLSRWGSRANEDGPSGQNAVWIAGGCNVSSLRNARAEYPILTLPRS